MPDPSSDALELRALEEKRRTTGLTPAEEARRAALQVAEPPTPTVKGFDIRAAAAGVRALIVDDASAPRLAPPARPVSEAPSLEARPSDGPSTEPFVASAVDAPWTDAASSAPVPAAEPAPAEEPLALTLEAPPEAAAERRDEPAPPSEPELVTPELLEEPELIEELEPIDDEPAIAASAPLEAPDALAGDVSEPRPSPPAAEWMAPPPSPDEPRPEQAYPASLELLAPTEELTPPSPASPIDLPAPTPTAAPSSPAQESPVPAPADVEARAPVAAAEPAPAAAQEPPADATPQPARYTAADYGLDPADPDSAAWAAWYAGQGWDPATAYAWAERMHREAAGAGGEGTAASADAGTLAAASDLRFEAPPASADAAGVSEPGGVAITTLEPAEVLAAAEPGTGDASGFMVPAPAAPALVPVPAEEEIAIEADLDATPAAATPEEDVAIEEAAEDVPLADDELAAAPPLDLGSGAPDLMADDVLVPEDALGPAAPLETEELPLGDDADVAPRPPRAPLPAAEAEDAARFELADSGTFSRAPLGLAGSADPLPAPLEDDTAALEGLEWVQASAVPGDELPVDLSTFEQPPVRGEDPSEHATVVWSLGQRGHTPPPTSVRAPPREVPDALDVLEDDILELSDAEATSLAPRDEDVTATDTFPPLAPLASAPPEALDDRTLVMPLGGRTLSAPPPPPARPSPLASAPSEALDDRTLVMPLGGRAVPPSPPPPAPPAPSTIGAPEARDDRTLVMPLGGRALQAPSPAPGASGAHVPGTHRVVVHTSEGEVLRGTITDASLDGRELVLLPQGGGVASAIPTDDVKAVFFMLPAGAPAPEATGQRVRVTFRDGRQVAGFSADYDPERLGFFMVPADSRTHTERIWVYRAAVRQVVVS